MKGDFSIHDDILLCGVSLRGDGVVRWAIASGAEVNRVMGSAVIDQREGMAQPFSSARHKVGHRKGAGTRLPAERDLADKFNVSRPTIREAMIALEIRDLVEVRHGSGVYVAEKLPSQRAAPELNAGAFELIEARLMFEGEAAALAAATVMAEGELDELFNMLQRMEAVDPAYAEELELDRRFHLAIAEGTQNSLISQAIENFWSLRDRSPLCRRMFEQAHSVGINATPLRAMSNRSAQIVPFRAAGDVER